MTARRGQVALYLVVVLVALTILMLANVGAFLAVRAKNHAMNAGDAAALAAARRQGELLNEIGRLNLRHAEADYRELCKPPAERDWSESAEIVRRQRRIAFLGPLDCVRAANEAAKANGVAESGEMTGILRRHVADISSKYMQNPDLYPEPWEGAWSEYSSELSQAVAGGLVAGPDNVEFLDAIECFPLTSKSFYSMIEGEAWCKLVVAGITGLLDVDLHNLPQPTYGETAAVVNSEVCSLHLVARPLLLEPKEAESLRNLLALNGASFPSPPPEALPLVDDRPSDDPSRIYFFYDESAWCAWSPQIAKANLPLVGTVKPEFDVKGCASVFRVIENIPQLVSETSRRSSWNAAAKPFGTIMTSSGRSIVTDEEAMGLVLPAFEAVRLVPLALADEKDLSTADAAWLDHVREHVPRLLTDGPDGLSASCRYCALLGKWNDPDFRARAAAWIAANAETCLRGSGGAGPSGGTSYAH